jgi:hypothetical protein
LAAALATATRQSAPDARTATRPVAATAAKPVAATQSAATKAAAPLNATQATGTATPPAKVRTVTTFTDRTVSGARTATWAVADFVRSVGTFGNTPAPEVAAASYETIQQPAFTGLRMVGAVSTGLGLLTLGALLLSLASSRADQARRRRIF